MPKGIFYNGMSKKQIAHNTALFNIILSKEESALTKGLSKLGTFANKLWTDPDTELISIYKEYREKVVGLLSEISLKSISPERLIEMIKNGNDGVSSWKDDNIIEFAMENYDEVKKINYWGQHDTRHQT